MLAACAEETNHLVKAARTLKHAITMLLHCSLTDLAPTRTIAESAEVKTTVTNAQTSTTTISAMWKKIRGAPTPRL